MFERLPKVERFDEMLAATPEQQTSLNRRSEPYTVGRADDSAERRADQVADRGLAILHAGHARLPASAEATATSTSRVQRSPVGGSVGLAGGALDDATSTTLAGALGRGQRFESHVQRDIRRSIGADVGGAHLHTDARADRLARSMQAQAFTVENNVFFAKGKYRPDTDAGMHTVLHEAAHLAEGAGRVQRMVVRRKVSATVADFDGSFKRRGLAASLGGSEISKIRDGLKRYHAASPGDPKQLDALQSLLKHADAWLRKHPTPKDRSEQSRIDLVDSIRTEAGIEYAKTQASNIYLGDAAASGVLGGQKAQKGPGSHPLQNLKQGTGFSAGNFAKRANPNNLGAGQAARARTKHGLGGPDPETEKALTAGLESLSAAEYAAIATYSEADYTYINPGIAGRTGKSSDKEKVEVEEASLHAGFIGEAWAKLPVWKGTTYRGQAMSQDFLQFQTSGQLKVNEYWSSTEAKPVAQDFIRNYCDGKHMAVLFSINVSNGRDISRMSSSGQELEILLPPGSFYKVGKRRCLTRGNDDDEIRRLFGDGVFDEKGLTEFWVVDLSQRYSDDNDPSGRYQSTNAPWQQATRAPAQRNFANPWVGMSGKRILNVGKK